MAIKNDLLGGTNWVNGDVLDADDLNDTFDATVTYSNEIIKKQSYSEVTEHTTASTSYVDVTNGTFTNTDLNGKLLLGIKTTFDAHATPGNSAYIVLEISGTNLGTKYIYPRNLYNTSGDNDVLCLGDTETELVISGGSYEFFHASLMSSLAITDSSVVFKFKYKQPGGNTAYIKNITLDLIYCGFEEV